MKDNGRDKRNKKTSEIEFYRTGIKKHEVKQQEEKT